MKLSILSIFSKEKMLRIVISLFVFYGKIEDAINCFQDFLTFNGHLFFCTRAKLIYLDMNQIVHALILITIFELIYTTLPINNIGCLLCMEELARFWDLENIYATSIAINDDIMIVIAEKTKLHFDHSSVKIEREQQVFLNFPACF